MTTEVKRAESVLHTYYECWQAKNSEGIAGLFAEDAEIHYWHEGNRKITLFKGEDIRKIWAGVAKKCENATYRIFRVSDCEALGTVCYQYQDKLRAGTERICLNEHGKIQLMVVAECEGTPDTSSSYSEHRAPASSTD